MRFATITQVPVRPHAQGEFRSILRGSGSKIYMSELAAWALEKKLLQDGNPDPL